MNALKGLALVCIGLVSGVGGGWYYATHASMPDMRTISKEDIKKMYPETLSIPTADRLNQRLINGACAAADDCLIRKVEGQPMYDVFIKAAKTSLFYVPAQPLMYPTGTDLAQKDVLITPRGVVMGGNNIAQSTLQQFMQSYKVDPKLFKEKNAIISKAENEKGSIILFTDPDCPYCKRFEEKIAPKLLKEGITIKTVLFPLVALHPDAHAKSRGIWCSPNQEVAMRELMLNSSKKDIWRQWDKQCANPIEENLALGRAWLVQGTPSVYNMKGEQFTGDMQRDLAAWAIKK